MLAVASISKHLALQVICWWLTVDEPLGESNYQWITRNAKYFEMLATACISITFTKFLFCEKVSAITYHLYLIMMCANFHGHLVNPIPGISSISNLCGYLTIPQTYFTMIYSNVLKIHYSYDSMAFLLEWHVGLFMPLIASNCNN